PCRQALSEEACPFWRYVPSEPSSCAPRRFSQHISIRPIAFRFHRTLLCSVGSDDPIWIQLDAIACSFCFKRVYNATLPIDESAVAIKGDHIVLVISHPAYFASSSSE